jgi:hypothetical protein
VIDPAPSMVNQRYIGTAMRGLTEGSSGCPNDNQGRNSSPTTRNGRSKFFRLSRQTNEKGPHLPGQDVGLDA